MDNFWKNKNVLVAGASGFIGSHVCDLLVEKGAKVTAIVSTSSSASKIDRNLKTYKKKINIKRLDLLDLPSVIKYTETIDIILNFAAKDGSATFKENNSSQIYRENTSIVLNILEAGRVNNVEKILLISSIEVYSSKQRLPFIESDTNYTLDESANGYVWSKRFTEVAAKIYSKQYGLKVVVARPGNVYGPRDYSKEKGRVIPLFIDKALKNEDITIWGNGLSKKSFIYISDFAVALLNLVKHQSLPVPINIASENVINIKDLANLIIRLTKSKSKIVFVNSDTLTLDRVAEVAMAKKIIKFKEKTTLSNGLNKTINYFKASK